MRKNSPASRKVQRSETIDVLRRNAGALKLQRDRGAEVDVTFPVTRVSDRRVVTELLTELLDHFGADFERVE